MADLDGDGVLDLVAGSYGSSSISILKGLGDGTFQQISSLSTPTAVNDIEIGDLNGDGVLDIVTAHATTEKIGVLIGNGDGSFEGVVSFETTEDADGVELSDINGDGKLDVLVKNKTEGSYETFLGDGTGNLSQGALTNVIGNMNSLETGDANGDGVDDIAYANGVKSSFLVLGNTTEVTTLPTLNINTQEGALATMDLMEEALSRVSRELGDIGSNQSRLATALGHLRQSELRYREAASRILDADISKETAELIRVQILQQAASAVLGQANQTPALALQLLST